MDLQQLLSLLGDLSPDKVIGNAALSLGTPATIVLIYIALANLKSWLDTAKGVAGLSRTGIGAAVTGFRTLQMSTWGQRWALLIMTICTPLTQLVFIGFCFVTGYYARIFVDDDKARWNKELEILQTYPTSLLNRDVFLELFPYDFTVPKYFMLAGAVVIVMSYLLTLAGKSPAPPGWILATPAIVLCVVTGVIFVVLLIFIAVRAVIFLFAQDSDWSTLVSGGLLAGVVATVPTLIFTGLFSASTIASTYASESLIEAWKGNRPRPRSV